MNNLTTTTETLPKTGHVNEVCKEWLVREDGALAYKLQSQEINDFYKGNRQRNAVVREDFPTALHEQIKERENAQKQVEAYRRRLTEQEEHDKRVAKEITEKLERDLQEQQDREFRESEEIAQRMQEIYVNMPPAPPPAARDKSKPPPRPAKASTLQQNTFATTDPQQPTTSNATRHHKQYNSQQQQQTYQHSHHNNHSQQQPQQQQPHHPYFADTNGYVGLSVNLSAGTPPHRQTKSQSNSNHLLVSAAAETVSTSTSPSTPSRPSQQHQAYNDFMTRSPTQNINDNNNFNAQPQYRQPHSSSAAVTPTSASSSISAAACSPSTPSSSASAQRRNNVFDFINITQQQHQQQQQAPNSPKISTHHANSPKNHQPTQNNILHTPTSLQSNSLGHNTSVEELIEYSDVADSIRRYDINASSSSMTSINNTDALDSPSKINRILSPSHENLLSSNEKKFQKLSPEKYDQIMGNADGAIGGSNSNIRVAEQQMQQHADDIELYVDPCDYASLKEIGLPMEEIKELSKKLKQEQKDELLARRLQEMESKDGLCQEERDRILAIEAQDKELARMLQEREKAKAKRAKEKARLRKSQQQKESSCGSSNSSHCGPLLPLPQDCMSSTKQRVPITSSPPYTSAQRHPIPVTEDPLDLEAYSNPIDVLSSQQRQPNGLLTNGSLTRETARLNNNIATHSRDDDIYTLPVDSCRPTSQRPASLVISPEAATGQHNSMTRSENYSLDSHGSLNGHLEIPPRMNYSKSAALDQSSSPTPPYMPIQGTRRSNSGEERKKKSKDKCTHQ